MKKLFIFISGIAIASMLLTACGGTAATPTIEPTAVAQPPTKVPTIEPTQVPTNVPTTPTTEPTAAETPTLTIWVDSLYADITQEIANGFAEEFGVNVVVQPMAFSDVRDLMLTSAPAGEGPDIVEAAHDWVGALVEGGVVAPVDLGDKIDEFTAPAIQAFTSNGQLYGVPNITENVALFRNTDIAEAAPATWDDLANACVDLEAAGVEYCLLLQTADGYHFYPILTSFGGYLFGRDDQGNYNPDDLGIDSEGGIASAMWLDQMVKDGHIAADIDFDTAKSLFIEGKAAYYITGPWNLPAFQEAGLKYAISPIPAGSEVARPFMGARGLMVNAFSPQLALAQAFLTEFWATPEAMQKFYDSTKKTPALLAVLNEIDDPDVIALGEAGKYAEPMPSIPEMAAFWTSMGDAITIILQQRADPTDTFKNAAEQMRTLILGQ